MATIVDHELDRKLRRAWETTILEEEGLFDFAGGTTGTEWNIASHLAWRVRAEFPDYDCDVELRKGDFDGRRPDIVVHRRGLHDFNYLVIEAKLDAGGQRMDREKIINFWFASPLQYAFGAAIVLGRDDCTIELLKNESAPHGRLAPPPRRTRQAGRDHNG